MNYDSTFSKRSAEYTYATDTYPHVMDLEFQTAVDMCDIKLGDTILNIPGACVPLDKYIPPDANVTYIAYEINAKFANLTNMKCVRLDSIPLDSHTLDTVISVASLHHINDAERNDMYREVYRLLKGTGKFIIADVLDGSPQADWLNNFVNTYNSGGHIAQFWSNEDISLLNNCNFDVETYIKGYTWDFTSRAEMVDYCRNLFGLDLANDNQILDGLNMYLKPVHLPDGSVSLPWKLIYFIAKPTVHPSSSLSLN